MPLHSWLITDIASRNSFAIVPAIAMPEFTCPGTDPTYSKCLAIYNRVFWYGLGKMT